MRHGSILLSALAAAFVMSGAAQARADTRFLAYDATDRITQAMTRGITLEVERGLFGAVRLKGLYSTTARGSALLDRGGPDAALGVMPEGSDERALYEVRQTGDGRGLARALCPGAETVWLATGRIRAARPLTMQAVGRWADGTYRHCLGLSYEWRGEWATPPVRATEDATP